MIQVRVRDQRVLDQALLGAGEGTAHGAGVNQIPLVDEKRGRALTESFGSIGAEHSYLH